MSTAEPQQPPSESRGATSGSDDPTEVNDNLPTAPDLPEGVEVTANDLNGEAPD
jgi:hypothetical protein